MAMGASATSDNNEEEKSVDDVFEDNGNKQVSFGAIDEDWRGPPTDRRDTLRLSRAGKSAAKTFRDERSVRFSALNKATNNAFVADAWAGKHRRQRTKYIMELSGTFILNMVIGTYYEGLAADFHPLVVVAAIILVVTIGMSLEMQPSSFFAVPFDI